MVAISPRFLIFDEPQHIEGARLLAAGASLRQVLDAPLQSAPGPLYPLVHWMLYPFTGFEAPGIRYANLFFLLLSIAGGAISFAI